MRTKTATPVGKRPLKLLAGIAVVIAVEVFVLLLWARRGPPALQSRLIEKRVLPNGLLLSEAEFFRGTGDQQVRFTVRCVSGNATMCHVASVNVRDESGGQLAAAVPLAYAGCVVNGGYFSDRFLPVGLMRSDGVDLSGAFTVMPLLSGYIVCGPDRPAELVQRGSADIASAQSVRQAGPFLIGPTDTAGNRTARSERTAIATSTTRIALLTTTATSLDDLVTALKHGEILGIPDITHAINLDGGPSSGMVYVSGDTIAGTEPRGRITDAIALQRW